MELSYQIIDLSSIGPDECPKIDEAFDLWQETYKKIASSSSESLEDDVFWRSRTISILSSQEGLVGFHLYNVYNLSCRSILNHSYMRQLDELTLASIRRQGIATLFSCEYLTVAESFRHNKQSIPAAELIMALSGRVFLDSTCDGLIGISREDRKVDKKSEELGCSVVGQTERYAIRCKVVLANRNQKESIKDPNLLRLVDDVWGRKQNSSLLIGNDQRVGQQRKAA